MLKRKLIKAGLVIQSLLVLVLPCGSYLKSQPTPLNHGKVDFAALRSGTELRRDTGNLSRSFVDSLQSSGEYAGKVAVAPAVTLNPKAKLFVAGYLKTNNEALVKIKKRSAPYFQIIESIFEKRGLPTELKYLAVIESELKTSAVSRVGAVGPWQLMPGTARALGLKVTSRYDERKLYYKSTVAVAKYLKDLYAEFDDWLLVIAAYNGGPGTVYKAIKKSGSRNFWQLQYALPAETRSHVKRFIGAHYYFDEKLSETTLTKKEAALYRQAMETFIKSQAVETTEPGLEIPPSINESATSFTHPSL
jgi:membrane-bound lytic murein transglycosylase D